MSEVPETDRNVTPKWQIAALALASGQSTTTAAQLADCTTRTIKRWRRKEQFRQLVDGYRAEVVDQALGKLTESVTKASDVFAELMSSSNEQVKLAAAKAAHDYRSRLRAEAVVTERLEYLERVVKELTRGNQTTDRQDAGDDRADAGDPAQGESDEPV